MFHGSTKGYGTFTCKDCGNRFKANKDSECYRKQLCPGCIDEEARWK